jgi:hypothetical protein
MADIIGKSYCFEPVIKANCKDLLSEILERVLFSVCRYFILLCEFTSVCAYCQVERRTPVSSWRLYLRVFEIQGDQKVCVHLMITVQKHAKIF